MTDDIVQFMWPLECDNSNVTTNDCMNTDVLMNLDFWWDLGDYLEGNFTFNLTDAPDFECNIIVIALPYNNFH